MDIFVVLTNFALLPLFFLFGSFHLYFLRTLKTAQNHIFVELFLYSFNFCFTKFLSVIYIVDIYFSNSFLEERDHWVNPVCMFSLWG